MTRSSLHAADETPTVTWEAGDEDRLSDLAALAVGTGFLPHQAEWHLFRGRRVVLRVSFVGGEVVVATWGRGDSLVARVFGRATELHWDDLPFARRGPAQRVPRWWQRPRLHVDAAATARARAADASGSAAAG